MTKIQNSKPYDLEGRAFQFAKAVRIFVKTLPKTIANIDDGKQLLVFDFIEISRLQFGNYLEFVIYLRFDALVKSRTRYAAN